MLCVFACSRGNLLLNGLAYFFEISVINFQDELRLLQFYMSNIEYASGTSLSNLSSLHWDQNEVFAQFGGEHLSFKQDGGRKLVDSFVDCFDVHLSCAVSSTVNDSAVPRYFTGQKLPCNLYLKHFPLILICCK